MYNDANNLYGWAMTQAPPYGCFEQITNVDNNFNFDISDDSHVGYILEVDLVYLEELNDAHNDLPLCPVRMKSLCSEQEKLLTTLLPKQKYILHYRVLIQALAQGLKLVKIHRLLKFNQTKCLNKIYRFQ